MGRVRVGRRLGAADTRSPLPKLTRWGLAAHFQVPMRVPSHPGLKTLPDRSSISARVTWNRSDPQGLLPTALLRPRS